MSTPPRNRPQLYLQMTSIIKPTNSDVLCGRGVTTNRHPGNESFRALVNCNKELYVSSTKKNKMMISRSIVEAVRNKPGRFLEKDAVTKLWMDIGDKKAIEKTSQALRDGAASLRKQLSEDLSDPDFLNAVFSSESELNESQTDSYKSNCDKNKHNVIEPNDGSEITQQHKRIKSEEESVAGSTLPSSYASSLHSSIDMDYEVKHNSKSNNSNNTPRPPLPSTNSNTKRHIRHHSLKTPCPVTSKATVTPPPAMPATPVTSSSAPVSPHPHLLPTDSYQPPYSNPNKRSHVRRHTSDVLPDQLYNNYSHHYPPSPTPSYNNPDAKFVTPYQTNNSPPSIQRSYSNPTTSYYNRRTPPPPPNYYSPTMPYHERKKYYSDRPTQETFDHGNTHQPSYYYDGENYGRENYNVDNHHQHHHHCRPPPTLPFRGTPHSVRDLNYPRRMEENRMMKEEDGVDSYEDLEMITPLPFELDEGSQEARMSFSTMIDLQNRL